MPPKRPIKILVTPHQFLTKFETQDHLPYISARLYVRKVGSEGGFELPVLIQNPLHNPKLQEHEKQLEGGRLIKSKKMRKGLKLASKAAGAAAIPAALVPGIGPVASAGLASSAIAMDELAGAGGAGPPKKKKAKKKLRYSLQSV